MVRTVIIVVGKPNVKGETMDDSLKKILEQMDNPQISEVFTCIVGEKKIFNVGDSVNVTLTVHEIKSNKEGTFVVVGCKDDDFSTIKIPVDEVEKC